ncbi:MAG: YicC/YloC family endoribonuclease [Candidatus Aerophobetes bacterium]|nr:YicC/YloC family endoribonuclease [Candidatus Aerophobetes bacterium]
MTGYGESKQENKKVSLYLQIKTVNHRFLDIDINSSQGIPFLWEKRIKELIRQKVKRGKVTVSVELSTKSSSSPKITVNQQTASQYYQTLSQLRDNLGLKDEINLSHLMEFPQIINIVEGVETKGKIVKDLLDKALSKSLENVLQMREKEGEKHLKSILKCIKKIKKYLSQIKEEIPLAKISYQNKIKENLKELLNEGKNSKIAAEISRLVNRGDITEEEVRFSSHLKQLENTLQEKGAVGKKLKFILQEMHREINTIGAKTNSLNISRSVIKIKQEIEKIAEEVKNIE